MPEVLMKVNHIVVYVRSQSIFHYTVSHEDSDSPTMETFDIRELPNWGWNPNTKQAKDRKLHEDVIRESLYHGHLDDFLIRNQIELISG